MQPIFCAVLLAMILHHTEGRCHAQDYENEDEGDYERPVGGRRGYRNQKPPGGGLLDQLTGLGKNFGLGGQRDERSGRGKKCPLAGLAQKFGKSGGQECPLAKLGGMLGSVLGGGKKGGDGGGDGLGSLLGGLGGLLPGKGSGSGKCGGRKKKFGSFGHGAESGRRGHRSDYSGEEESGRGGRYGSQYGRRQDRYSGYGRQTEDDDEENY
ncbi:uncharacterized protein RB166_015147 [Leptodactylus fuscus]|uniref:uncharacterized protein LOC142212508 n=1 Tax=Leptodactylus fuscus TaxID=238119 RepID=UPI003F4EDE43